MQDDNPNLIKVSCKVNPFPYWNNMILDFVKAIQVQLMYIVLKY